MTLPAQVKFSPAWCFSTSQYNLLNPHVWTLLFTQNYVGKHRKEWAKICHTVFCPPQTSMRNIGNMDVCLYQVKRHLTTQELSYKRFCFSVLYYCVIHLYRNFSDEQFYMWHFSQLYGIIYGAIMTAMKLFTRPTHVQQVLSLTLVSSTYLQKFYKTSGEIWC